MRFFLTLLLVVLFIYNVQAQHWRQTSSLELSGTVTKGITDYSRNPAMDIFGNTAVISDNSKDVVNLFEKKDGRWQKIATLRTSNIDDTFGYNVTLSEDVVLVSGWRNDIGAGYASGVVYLFQKPESGWKDMTETAVLYASDGAYTDAFGAYGTWPVEGGHRIRKTAIDNDLIVVESRNDDDMCWNCGSAYIFEKPEGGWKTMSETGKLILSKKEVADGGRLDGTSECAVKEGNIYLVSSNKVFVFERPENGWKTINNESGTIKGASFGNRIRAVSKDEILLLGLKDQTQNGLRALSIKKKGATWETPDLREIPLPQDVKVNTLTIYNFDSQGNTFHFLAEKYDNHRGASVIVGLRGQIDGDGSTWQNGNVQFSDFRISEPAKSPWFNVLEASENDIVYSSTYEEGQYTKAKPVFFEVNNDESYEEVPSDFQEFSKEVDITVAKVEQLSESKFLVKASYSERYDLYELMNGEWRMLSESFKDKGVISGVYGDHCIQLAPEEVMNKVPGHDTPIVIGYLSSLTDKNVEKKLIFPIPKIFNTSNFYFTRGIVLNDQIIIYSRFYDSELGACSIAAVCDLDFNSGKLSVLDYKWFKGEASGNPIINDNLVSFAVNERLEGGWRRQLNLIGYEKENSKIKNLKLLKEIPAPNFSGFVVDGDFLVQNANNQDKIRIFYRQENDQWVEVEKELVTNSDFWKNGGVPKVSHHQLYLKNGILCLVKKNEKEVLRFDLNKIVENEHASKRVNGELVSVAPHIIQHPLIPLGKNAFLFRSNGALFKYERKEQDAINFDNQTITYSNEGINLTATSESGVPVNFDYEAGDNILNINGAQVSIASSGRVLLRAYTDENSDKAPAEKYAFVTVNKASQNITVQKLTETLFIDNDYPLSFTSDSGLPVTAEIIEGEAELKNGILRPSQPGKVLVRFTQEGDDRYLAAPQIERSYSVAKVTGVTGQSAFNVFPNPSNGEITVTTYGKGKSTFIRLVSLEGKTLFKKTVSNKEHLTKIRISEPGMYILKIQFGNQSDERRVLIK
ncbi:hypothetical protein FUAX_43130 (plasmid) [Fulvitalea axinellae]|uniref:Secretion system C-terminal sorting domain-containing protein n=1 Tax=Fulvitalea axinellae TaxID=1182444 RepID=A0AAU9CRV9_9BACT|nr:hypothetical protein FUAX_43130 [Fulvitalea axinellae]